MHSTQRIVIRGLGAHVPDRVLTNQDLERMVETSDEWIVTRTGIRTRRLAAEGEAASDLAVKAAEQALEQAGMAATDLTHVLCATMTPDAYIPSAACLLAHKLGCGSVPAMDLNAACSGFLYGLETARALVALYPEARVLVAASEVLSSRVNWADRATCVLFGDGCGAAVLSAETTQPSGPVVLDVLLAADAAEAQHLTVKGGGSGRPYRLGEQVGADFFVQMQGQEVYRWAVRSMTDACRQILKRHELALEDVDVFISHQANLRIIEAVGKKLRIADDKVFVNVDRYGNTSGASIPIAMTEAMATGFARPGHLGLLTAFGGGFTWGAALVRF